MKVLHKIFLGFLRVIRTLFGKISLHSANSIMTHGRGIHYTKFYKEIQVEENEKKED